MDVPAKEGPGSWLLGVFADCVLAIPVLLGIVLAFYQVGPWLWLVQGQIALLGAYYPSLTFVAYLILVTSAVVLVSFTLTAVGLRGRPFVLPIVERLTQSYSALPQAASWVVAIPLIGGSFLFGFGVYRQALIWTAGPRTSLEAADLEAGHDPGSRWLVVRGIPLLGKPLVWTENDVVKEQTIAVVSPEWKPGDPVAVLVNFRGSKNAALPAKQGLGTFEGLASINGVPGLTRSEFEGLGEKLTPTAVLIEAGDTPESMSSQTFWLLVSGGILIPVGVVVWIGVALVTGQFRYRIS